VVGSASLRSRAQLDRLCRIGAAVLVTVDPGAAPRPNDGEPLAAAQEAARIARAHLDAGRSVVLASPEERRDPARAMRLLSAAAVAAARPTRGAQPSGLFLTGGETALAVVRGLGVERIEVCREVSPGVPAVRLLGPGVDLPAVTKAGGFGVDSVMVDAFARLGEGSCLR